jgi:hypothetical protein
MSAWGDAACVQDPWDAVASGPVREKHSGSKVGFMQLPKTLKYTLWVDLAKAQQKYEL